MLFTQWNLEDALEVRYEEGLEDGELRKTIKLVNRKYHKGKSEATIAEELEESPEMVEKICKAIQTANTDDVNVIYEKFQKM